MLDPVPAARFNQSPSGCIAVCSASTLRLAGDSIRLDAFVDPLLVDPSPKLVAAIITAYADAAAAVVTPTVEELQTTAASERQSSLSQLPSVTILARTAVLDAVTGLFRRASRLAALVERDHCELLQLPRPQPNTVLVGRKTGCVVVTHRSDCPGESPIEWLRVGDDPSLRDRYAPVVDAAEPYRLRVPSRHRVYDAFTDRCGPAVAGAVIRAFDAGGDPFAGGDGKGGYAGESDPESAVGPKARAYAVGVVHEATDGALRRACEDAGVGSRSTFTRIKSAFVAAGLCTTEPVSQPVGRPKERLKPKGLFATADEPRAVIAAIQTADL